MELTQLRHFLAAAHHKNLVKAAEEQNITQSGLSRSIINLEKSLGMGLFERTSQGLELTAFGVRLIPHAKQILNEEKRAKRELHSLQQLKTGTVSMAITLNFSHTFIPDVIDAVLGKNPGIEIEVESGAYADLLEGVRQSQFDFLFGLLISERPPPDLVIEELFTTRSIIIADGRHPLAREKDVSLSDLSRATWAMLNSRGFQRAFALHFYSRGMAIPYQAFRTNSIALLRTAILKKQMLSILPKELVAEDLAVGRLVQIDAATPADFSRAGLVFRADALFTPAAEFVMQQIRLAAAVPTLDQTDVE
jgi:DNA-binding transcriptional LysR family regulator